jgi:mono/diheme cytochrome c family protein
MAVSVFAALVVVLAAAPSFSKGSPDGKRLYAKYCENCHGPVAKSDVRGATLAEIKYSMTGRMCGEAGGDKLTDSELGAVARALTGKTR